MRYQEQNSSIMKFNDSYSHLARCSRALFAFTLIELLVVIAIIALLVSILMPSLNKAKDLAKRATCGSNYHSMGLLLQMYMSDNGGFPRGDAPDMRALNDWGTTYYGLGALHDYAEDNSLENLDHGDPYTKRGIFACTDPVAGGEKVNSVNWIGNFTTLMYIGYFQYSSGYLSSLTGNEYSKLIASPIDPDDIETGAALVIDIWDGPAGAPWTAYLTGSSSHGMAGTNILYADGGVAWKNSIDIGDDAVNGWPTDAMLRSAYNR